VVDYNHPNINILIGGKIMGCDIHLVVERLNEKGIWEPVEVKTPFYWRCYGMFGFLADVRNYSHVPCISPPRGFPNNVSALVKKNFDDYNYHSHSWLSIKELSDYNYDQTFWNRRITKQLGPNSYTGAGLAENPETEGEHLTIREFLGDEFFKDLKTLQQIEKDEGEIRIIFCFDN
jgi:hypothetical protein